MDSVHEIAKGFYCIPEALLTRLGDQSIGDALIGAGSELGL
ncbi:MAG TPA: hypothetical protein VIK31_09185 [Propionibacteriaceae bacterium]